MLQSCTRAGAYRAEGAAAPPVCWANKASRAIFASILESFSGKFFLTTRAQSEKVGQISFRPPIFFLPVRPCTRVCFTNRTDAIRKKEQLPSILRTYFYSCVWNQYWIWEVRAKSYLRRKTWVCLAPQWSGF
jgi:hypothetical protein